jgi:hypothetical protein
LVVRPAPARNQSCSGATVRFRIDDTPRNLRSIKAVSLKKKKKKNDGASMPAAASALCARSRKLARGGVVTGT